MYDDEAVYGRRVIELESAASAGTEQLPPTLFLAGVEQESAIVTADGRGGFTIGGASIEPLDWRDQASMIDAVKAEAVASVAGLRPLDDEQAAKQTAWLEGVDRFTLSDAVNYRLYREFSRSTLGETGVPADAGYDGIRQHTIDAGWLEFRFGGGTHQTGYYDNEGITEFRVNPCPPAEAVRRMKTIMSRLGHIAASFGAKVFPMNKHLNLSVHQADADQRFNPVFGSDPRYESTSLDAAAGIAAAVADAAWMSYGEAGNADNLEDVEERGRFLLSARSRRALHLRRGYLEMHGRELAATTAHGLVWTMAAMSHGLEQGAGRIADAGYQTPSVKDDFLVVPTAAYDRFRHIHILGAMRESELGADGRFRLDERYNSIRSQQLSTALLAGTVALREHVWKHFNNWAVGATHADQAGTLHCTDDALLRSYGELPQDSRELLQPFVDLTLYRGAMAQVIDRSVKAVSVVRRPLLSGENPYAGAPPAALGRRMLGSEVMRRAFGDELPDHVAYLMDRAQIAYDIRHR